MLNRSLRRLACGLLCILALLFAHSAFASSTNTPALFTDPIQKVVDWVTGDVGRLLSIVVLAIVGMTFWKKRSDDKGERVLLYVVGTAIVLGATNIVAALGFVGATY